MIMAMLASEICAMFVQQTKYNKAVPVLQCHGTHDPLVRFAWGQETSQFICSFNPNLQFKTYEGMMHSSCPEVRSPGVAAVSSIMV